MCIKLKYVNKINRGNQLECTTLYSALMETIKYSLKAGGLC